MPECTQHKKKIVPVQIGKVFQSWVVPFLGRTHGTEKELIQDISWPRWNISQNDQNVSKGAKNQVLWFSNEKQSYSAFFVSVLMYSNMVPRTFLNIWKLSIFSRSNSSILRNKEKVRTSKNCLFSEILKFAWNIRCKT